MASHTDSVLHTPLLLVRRPTSSCFQVLFQDFERWQRSTSAILSLYNYMVRRGNTQRWWDTQNLLAVIKKIELFALTGSWDAKTYCSHPHDLVKRSLFWTFMGSCATNVKPINWPITSNSIYKSHNNSSSDIEDHSLMIVHYYYHLQTKFGAR